MLKHSKLCYVVFIRKCAPNLYIIVFLRIKKIIASKKKRIGFFSQLQIDFQEDPNSIKFSMHNSHEILIFIISGFTLSDLSFLPLNVFPFQLVSRILATSNRLKVFVLDGAFRSGTYKHYQHLSQLSPRAFPGAERDTMHSPLAFRLCVQPRGKC